MTQFNWRAKWQPRTKVITLPDGTETGGYEVVDVRPTDTSPGGYKGGWLSVVIWVGSQHEHQTHHEDGVYFSGEESPYDLLPVEQPAKYDDEKSDPTLVAAVNATCTDTKGRDVTGLIGLQDESDVVWTAEQIAALIAERDGLREARDGLHELFLQRGQFCQSLVEQLQIMESAIRLILPVVAHPDIEGTLQDALKRANKRRQKYEESLAAVNESEGA